MKNLDPKAIEHIAKLAKLHVSPEEAQEFSQQLTKILGYFDQISKIDTSNVEPLVTPSDVPSHWRKDEPVRELSAEEIVANSPQKTGNLFTVPPVV